MADVQGQALRSLPSVSSMLLDPRIEAAAGQLLPRYVSELVRSEQDRTRAEILAGRASSADGLIDRDSVF
jgi:hypothetical protein